MPAIQKRTQGEKKFSMNGERTQITKKAKLDPNSQPSGFEEDLKHMNHEIKINSGMF